MLVHESGDFDVGDFGVDDDVGDDLGDDVGDLGCIAPVVDIGDTDGVCGVITTNCCDRNLLDAIMFSLFFFLATPPVLRNDPVVLPCDHAFRLLVLCVLVGLASTCGLFTDPRELAAVDPNLFVVFPFLLRFLTDGFFACFLVFLDAVMFSLFLFLVTLFQCTPE